MGAAAEITVGLDIGTTSVKAVAADQDGSVVARTRVPHRLLVPAADRMEHDITEAWHDGVERAWADVSRGLDVRAATVAAMVPSLGAIDPDGRGLGPGLLYGDGRGAGVPGKTPAGSGEVVGFLAWLAEHVPDAAHYLPAQGAANLTLAGEAAIDSTTAMTMMPLYTGQGWDERLVAGAAADSTKLPRVEPGFGPVGRIRDSGTLLGGGTIDAMGEQLVAGADEVGDVLVILGTTLIVWAVIPEWVDRPGVWTIPHTAPGKMLIGGPSNAGGLFLNWAFGLTGCEPARDEHRELHPDRVPVFSPYVRGERVPLHDPHRRAALHGLDLTHGPVAVRRAAYEASGFVVRHLLELGGSSPRRLVLTGGGTRVDAWIRAVVDATGLPADVVAVPEGGALGAAFCARVTAGLEQHPGDGARWARIAHQVEPDPVWSAAMRARYETFVGQAGGPAVSPG